MKHLLKLGEPFHRYSVTALFHFTDRRNIPLIRQMGEIDEAIEAHGGWPDAFVTDPERPH